MLLQVEITTVCGSKVLNLVIFKIPKDVSEQESHEVNSGWK